MSTSLFDLKLLKSKMVCRKVDNEMVLVPLVNEVAEMKVIYTLNEVATFIWESIDAAQTVDDIADAVTENFDIDKQTALNDIFSFFSELNENVV